MNSPCIPDQLPEGGYQPNPGVAVLRALHYSLQKKMYELNLK